MSLEDFCSLSPGEFSECFKAYAEQREQDAHLLYEVARYNALIAISPHVKRKPALPFPWEQKKKVQKSEPVSREDSWKRFEALKIRKAKEENFRKDRSQKDW